MKVLLHTVVFKIPGADDAFVNTIQELTVAIRKECQVLSLNFGPCEGQGDFTHMLTLITRNKDTLAKYTVSEPHQKLKQTIGDSGLCKGLEAYDVGWTTFPKSTAQAKACTRNPISRFRFL